MNDFVFVAAWVLPAVLCGIGVGMYIGGKRKAIQQQGAIRTERDKTIRLLEAVVEVSNQLTEGVGHHNQDLNKCKKSIYELKAKDELVHVQDALLTQITRVLASNRRLEDDLVCTRYQLEEQSLELNQAKQEARIDALSGIANRKSFDERLGYLLSSYSRDGQEFALILADIDRFKWINDTHGHVVGDHVVTRVGELLQKCLRDTDFVARYGGDEFAFLLPGVDLNVAKIVGERCRAAIASTNFDSGNGEKELSVTFSMGLTFVRKGDNATRIINRADEALYKSKHSGRNQLSTQLEPSQTADALAAV